MTEWYDDDGDDRRSVARAVQLRCLWQNPFDNKACFQQTKQSFAVMLGEEWVWREKEEEEQKRSRKKMRAYKVR